MKHRNKIRAPRIVGDIEFNVEDSGLGSEEGTGCLTKFEAILIGRHWLAMMWAVETTWDCGTSGNWEVAMHQYANWRLTTLVDGGHITKEELKAVADEWNWPPFPDPDEVDPETWEMMVQDEPWIEWETEQG